VRKPGPYEGAIPEPTEREFHQLRDLILEHAGIHLSDTKKPLVYGRLVRRLRELELETFGEYYRRVLESGEELTLFLDRITTNETHFFREPHHFVHLAERFLPALVAAAAAGQRPKSVRVWSAGCSTGEEPYSVAMTLFDRLPASGWSIDILATDLSTRVLDVARSATWPVARAFGSIPEPFLHKFMLRGVRSREGWVRACPQLRAAVRVQRLNLNEEVYPAEAPFDLIFCRNVLIYFQPARRQRVLARLMSRLAPGGQLFVGHAESVQGLPERVRCVSPTVYARAGDAAAEPTQRTA
jgi:chemotaxis protein methyltransferase CheR